MGSQQFCLKWNNHQSNMLVVFDQLLQNEAFVDVTLACEGISLKAHKMVLSACSPYFQNLFLENPCKHPIVILNSIRYCDLKAIVDFMYKGEVNVSQDQLSALLKTADVLKVKGLAEVTNQTAKCLAESQPSRPPPPPPLTTTSPPPPMTAGTGTNLSHSSSPPAKRKKIRNGNIPSPTPVQQSTKSVTSDKSDTECRTIPSTPEFSDDKVNNHESHALRDEETREESVEESPQIRPQMELNIPSSPESDDKTFLKGLQSEIIFEPTESPAKDYHQLPTGSATTLSTLLTTDQNNPQHSISFAPSTSGIQNPSSVDWSASSWLKQEVLATAFTPGIHATHLSFASLKPRKSVHSKLMGLTNLPNKLPLKRGPKTLLTEEEENAVVDYIHSFTGRGTRPRRDEIIRYASSILRQKSGVKEEDETDVGKTKVGIKWWKKFRARHPELRDMRGNIPKERTNFTMEMKDGFVVVGDTPNDNSS